MWKKCFCLALVVLPCSGMYANEEWITTREWPYLTAEALQTRYAITSYLLRDCDTIIEIGGYRTPISQFVTDKTVIVIDPKIEQKISEKVVHLPLKIQDWDFSIESANYAVVILGMDLHLDEKGWKKVLELIHGSKRTILEFSDSYKPARQQFQYICENTSKNRTVCVKLDLSENDASPYPEFYPYRNLYCLE